MTSRFNLFWLVLCCLLAGASAIAETPRYRAVVLEQREFERRNFVQGLEIIGDRLLVSSGLYGQSAVRAYNWPAMTLQQEQPLPMRIFAEGLTQVDDRLFVLTWRARQMLVLDATTLEPIGAARIPGEGWGITHNGTRVYFSDGSSTLYSVDVQTGGELSAIAVTLDGKPVARLNELEWVDGEIWANIWQTDSIVRIDPTTGQVTGVIDLSGLLKPELRLRDTDVLNGIAKDPATGDIWVTGKRWPRLFRIALEPEESAN